LIFHISMFLSVSSMGPAPLSPMAATQQVVPPTNQATAPRASTHCRNAAA
jgi:hypothetical protein